MMNSLLNYVLMKQIRYPVMMVMIVGLIVIMNISVFVQIQSNNHFRFMSIPRLHRPSDLKQKYRRLLIVLHPDKNNHNKDEFIKLKQIFIYLQNQRNREYHDRYGITYENVDVMTPELKTSIIEATLVYGFYLVFLVLQLDYLIIEIQSILDIKVVLSTVFLSFYSMEVYYLLKPIQLDSGDIIDQMLNSTTLYERIQFMRICSGPITSLVIILMHSSHPDLVDKNIRILDQIINNQKTIDSDIKIDHIQRNRIKQDNLTKANLVQADLIHILKGSLHSSDHKR